VHSSVSVRFTGSATRLPDSVALLLGVLLYESDLVWAAGNEFRLVKASQALPFLDESHLVVCSKSGRNGSVCVLAIDLSGLLNDRFGKPIYGVPAIVMRASRSASAAFVRGAFAACPTASRRNQWVVRCPNPARALALRALLRKCEIGSQVRSSDSSVVVDAVYGPDLQRIGVNLPALKLNSTTTATVGRDDEVLDAVNRVRRDDQIDRTRWALDVLGADVDGEVIRAARLRLDYPDASLDELGRMLDPPVSRHTICGRLRRLHHRAVKVAAKSSPALNAS
jgi:hypothetical protein